MCVCFGDLASLCVKTQCVSVGLCVFVQHVLRKSGSSDDLKFLLDEASPAPTAG